MLIWGPYKMPWVLRIEKPDGFPLGTSDNKIRFVWCTDVHLDATISGPLTSLNKAINDCHIWKPNAFISTGDMSNDRLEDLQMFMAHIWRCQRPAYVLLGEHDLSEYPPGSYGSPDVAEVAGEAAMNMGPPFNYSVMLTSGDGTFKALCLFMDATYYDDDPTPEDAPGNSDYHEPGDRWGISDIMPAGGWCKRFPQEELDWVAATLAANESDAVLVFTHQPPPASGRVTNFSALADVLQPDPRPMIGFAGHFHTFAKSFPLQTTDGLRTFPWYTMTDMLAAYGWCRVTLSFAAGDIVVDGLDIYNFTDPGGYTVEAPFTVI